jgi:squalene-associated FAD-dependent desaturase
LSRTVYVIGAGLAGLSAAIALAGGGERVVVLEAAAQAGGRCRSYVDRQLGMTIDNGNHLVLSGNRAVQAYLAEIGASDRLSGPADAVIAFADLMTGDQWAVRLNEGFIPWWILDSRRRTPGTSATDYLGLAGLWSPPAGRRIDQVISCKGSLWRGLMQPFLLAVLNTEPEAGDARLASAVIRETLAVGGQACRPRIAWPTLAGAFVDPAVAHLERRGGQVRLGQRVRRLGLEAGRLTSLSLGEEEIALGPDDAAVLAVPPWVAQDLLPGLEAPDEFRGILNAHFRIAPPAGAEPMVGLIGATAEWVFAFEDRISVTVSAADRLLDMDRESLAAQLWADVARLHRLPPELPPWQIVKEKRATFAATPEQNAKRPGARTRWPNLVLAGDWTDTGLPATIEGALRSGRTAAGLVAAGKVA